MSLYLHRVEIENFRTFGAFAVSMPMAPGLLIVSGPNGLGKSSFFDAMEWCLTGRVQRFERFVRKSDTEAHYLTREGTLPFSHSATMAFDRGEPIARAGHHSNSPQGTASATIESLLVSESWGQQVSDVSTYLGLTHFLGQASHQRFMSRDATDQWRALRVPAGVARLEQIRLRLRGKAAQIAFNRRAEAMAVTLSQKRDGLARWDGLVQRLRRLEGASMASGVLSRDQILQNARRLRDALGRSSGVEPADESLSVEEILADLRETLAVARRTLDSRKAALGSLASVPEQYAVTVAGLADTNTESERLELSRMSTDAAQVSMVTVVAEAEKARDVQQARLQRVRERIALLLGALADTRESVAAEERAKAAGAAAAAAEQALAEVVRDLSLAEEATERLRVVRAQVAAAEHQAEEARKLANEWSVVERLLSEQMVKQRWVEGSRSALRARGEAEGLAERLRTARAAIQAQEQSLALRQAKAGTIASAVAAIAAHLSEHDTECPLCRTEFALGQLLTIAKRSASVADDSLLEAQVALESERGLLKSLEEDLAAVNAAADEVKRAEGEQAEAVRRSTLAHESLAAKLGVSDASQAATAIEELQRRTSAELQARMSALSEEQLRGEELEANIATLKGRKGRIERQVLSDKALEAQALQERGVAQARFAARLGGESLDADVVASALAAAEADCDQVSVAAAAADAALDAARLTLANNRSEYERIVAQLRQLDRVRSHMEEERSAYAKRWRGEELALPPSMSTLLQATSTVERRVGELEAAESEHRELVEAFQALSHRDELETVRRLIRGEAGERTIEDHRSALQAAVDESVDEERKVRRVHAAVERLADRLQSEADAFSNTILKPLNDLIGAFNDALLTTPGTSVAFNTDYRRDRTGFTMQVRRRQGSGAAQLRQNLNPQLLLSEGQLAANGFSILCSASVSYPWSNWRALLLDDPLQHNDVIHAAAFTDLMRNLISVEGYQVLMSSHDRGETDFIERKCTSAQLPCVVVHLLGDSPEGVRYEVQENQVARRLLDGPTAQTAG